MKNLTKLIILLLICSINVYASDSINFYLYFVNASTKYKLSVRGPNTYHWDNAGWNPCDSGNGNWDITKGQTKLFCGGTTNSSLMGWDLYNVTITSLTGVFSKKQGVAAVVRDETNPHISIIDQDTNDGNQRGKTVTMYFNFNNTDAVLLYILGDNGVSVITVKGGDFNQYINHMYSKNVKDMNFSQLANNKPINICPDNYDKANGDGCILYYPFSAYTRDPSSVPSFMLCARGTANCPSSLNASSPNNIVSDTGGYKLIMQSDGNLVLYNASGRDIWASGSVGYYGNSLVMQTDGNLVMYDANGRPLWASGTMNSGATYLALGDDGNLGLYKQDGSAVWTTGTSWK